MDYLSKTKAQLITLIDELERKIEGLQSLPRHVRTSRSRKGTVDGDILSHKQDLLAAVLDNTIEMVFIKDRQCRFILNNNAHIRFMGFKKQEEMYGKTDFDIFPRKIADRFNADDQHVILSGEPLVDKEYYVADFQGTMRWITATKAPVRDSSGEIIGLVGVSRDITSRKKFEDELMHERQLLHTLMDNVPDSIYFKDSSSRFIRVNKAWANRRNLADPGDAIGKTDFDFFPRHIAQEYYNAEQQIIRSRTPHIGEIGKIEIPGQPVRWISITKVPVIDNNNAVIGTCGISRDITTHMLTEDALAKERDMLHTLMKFSTDFIYFKDCQSRFTRINKAHAQWLGYDDPEQLIGKSDFDVHSEEHARDAFRDEQRIIRTGQPLIGKIENESRPGAPEERWALTSKGPIFDKNRTAIGTFGISRNITQLMQYEEALKKAKTELEKRVEERTNDLTEANKRLENRISQLDFLTSAGYELAQFTVLNELLPAIINAFTSRFRTAWASICLKDEKGYSCLAANGPLESAKGKKSSEDALAVFIKCDLRRPFMVKSWPGDEHIGTFAWPDISYLPYYIAIPLQADNRTIAIVQIFTDADGAATYENEEKVLATLAVQSAISLSNAVHFRHAEEKARLQGELDAAHTIQQSFTPRFKPPIPNVALKGFYHPAFEVGGDYLDYYKTESGDWVIVIADVCGKGIPAALLMAVLRSTFRVEAKNKSSAKQLLCAVNESMKANLDDQSFVTSLCCIISHDGSRMTYARAGHPNLIKINAGANTVEFIESEGVALGLIGDTGTFSSLMTEVTIPLNPGDRYLMYTDGLSEAWNDIRACYGMERLTNILQRAPADGPESLIDTVISDVKSFTGDASYHDDLTLLAIQVTSDKQNSP